MMEANKKHGRKKRAMNCKHKRTVKQEQHQLPPKFLGNAIEKGMKLDIRQPQQFAVQRHFKENPETRGEKEIPYFSAKASTQQMKPSSPLHRVTFQAPKNRRHFVHPAVSSSQPPMGKDSNYKGKGKECEISPPDTKSGETKHICDEEEANKDSGVEM